MSDKGESIEEAEIQAIKVLEPQLARHLALTDLGIDVIMLALNRAPDLPVLQVPQSRKVTTALLVRIANDARSAAHLVLRGYSLQAFSIIASTYEAAYTIAAIGSDNNLAQQWIDHDDPTRPFMEVRKMTQKALVELQVQNPDTQTSVEYLNYRQLCMAKHSNPLLQKQHGYKLQGGEVVFMNGPDVSEGSVRVAWFALERAAQLASVAIASFAKNHIPSDLSVDLMNQVKALGVKRNQLVAEAKVRGWGEDPYPGKWRV